jgi:hypothetical protein
MKHTTRARLLAAGALMAFATLAHPQYMWIDEKGLKQFSDRPPPPSIPLKNILKAPHGVPTAASIADETPAAPATEAAKPKAPPTLADRDADFRKRAKEQAEREQKDKNDARIKAEQADNCESARAARRSIDAGERIVVRDKNGERRFMDDAERAREGAKADKIAAACR